MVEFHEEKEEKILAKLRLKEEEDLAMILSEKYDIPYLDLTTTAINTDALRLIPEHEARASEMAAFKLVGKELYIAVHSPKSEKVDMVVRDLKRRDYKPFLYLVSKRSLRKAWDLYKELSFAKSTPPGVLDLANEEIDGYIKKTKNFEEFIEIINDKLLGRKKYDISRLMEVFIAGALATDASDIHIEPQEKKVRLRFRLDGVLHDLVFFDHNVFKLLLSRIKLVSGLKLNIKDTGQDGRFSIMLKGGAGMEVRTSVVPEPYGESIVMRILNPKTLSIPFKKLGMEPKLHQIFEHEITKPNGMLLNTGPTGSGKTTTLYAFLREILTSKINIITIEDPIEYHLPGINQTQVNAEKGYTFFQGLTSALRQDPDIIMVGEIREEKTAKTAIHASLTGHLVFSTLHTNNAAGTIPRLIDLAVNPKVIGSALNISIAQRLVRVLCKFCKKKETPTSKEKKFTSPVVRSIHKMRPDIKIDTSHLWKARKCKECNHTGYKGRIGIFEAILIDEKIEKMIHKNPSERDIKEAALHQGILDMRQDGVMKVYGGTTSLEELQRVIDIEDVRQ